ncbi:hypothetical protein LTS07_001276 [Exophiala sideris]|uniref:F-box domain-containing protein n=1 Tax=Exophiala sideris TaxID=1016849 RepID=A0ABR0JPS8_9EURO|nr:hypothetical protein LTS07_001276 [Exophiala sideris]KAK5043792.1 hypothetical protein LTR13_000146 [Exophiala sideris]KAK5067291.1 hypothetical protein LTR69_001278 [Exophiala sideris]KAK5182624.1 hypothetical protein LTR44_005015 [Eurotiomycetes sp. CCFEE 6388]
MESQSCRRNQISRALRGHFDREDKPTIYLQTKQATAMTAEPQDQSPLFKLPAEIRLHIFELALTSYDDISQPHRTDRKFYRPEYHYHRKFDCALLQTCRHIYQETRLLPVSVNEHVFWVYGGAPWKSMAPKHPGAKWREWYESLNEEQNKAVQTVHFFIQQHHLEGIGFSIIAHHFLFRTARLHLTLRHQDWWSREAPTESSDRLGICPWRESRTSCQQMLAEPVYPNIEYIKERMDNFTWEGMTGKVQGLEALNLEFEIDEVKKPQLQVVVERAKGWRFPLVGKDLVLEWTGELKESAWEGIRDLKDDIQVLKEKPVSDDLPKRKYYVVTMTWKAVRP